MMKLNEIDNKQQPAAQQIEKKAHAHENNSNETTLLKMIYCVKEHTIFVHSPELITVYMLRAYDM